MNSKIMLFGVLILSVVFLIMLSTPAVIYHTQTDPDIGLVSHYTLDSTLNDQIGSMHGSGYNTSYVSSKYGQSFDFNTESYVGFGSNHLLNHDSGSLSFWVYPESLAVAPFGNKMHIFGKSDLYKSYIALTYPGYTLVGETNTNSEILVNGGNVPINTWTHVVVVFDSDISKTYINGNFNQQNSITNSLSIGQFSNSEPSARFHGKLDEVRFYNIPLNEVQITSLYQAGNLYFSSASCSDGIKNGDEVFIDCGDVGSTCGSCGDVYGSNGEWDQDVGGEDWFDCRFDSKYGFDQCSSDASSNDNMAGVSGQKAGSEISYSLKKLIMSLIETIKMRFNEVFG